MDVHTALSQRRTIHRYRAEPIPEEALTRALQAAILAPNHKLTFPWRFTMAGPQTREQLAEIAIALRQVEQEEPLDQDRVDKIRAKILDPGELVVVSLLRCEDPMRAREDYASAACAIQNLTLSLWAEGLGSKWSTGKVTRDPRSYEVLEIDTQQEEIIGFIWVGLPAKTPDTPKRPPLDTFLRQHP